MNWKSIGKKIGGAAPMVATLFGGPAAGAVTSMVASALGVEESPEAIDGALRNDPSALLKLKELEGRNKIELEKLVFESKKLDAEIIISSSQEATKRNDADMKSDNWLSKNVRPIVLLSLTFATVWAVFDSSVSEAKLAALTSLDTMVYGYYFIGRSGEKGVFRGITQAFKRK